MHGATTTTTTTKPSLMTRLRGRNSRSKTVKTTTTSSPGTKHRKNYGVHKTHHHKRKATMGDKVSGAMLKMKGTLTHRPGVKAAGTRRMHGTDGRGSHY